jgi:hypothetical protein
MNTFNRTLLYIDEGNLELSSLVTILEVVTNKINIDTISGMARKENKSPNGIRASNQYRKIKIGCQVMAIKGLEDKNLPF